MTVPCARLVPALVLCLSPACDSDATGGRPPGPLPFDVDWTSDDRFEVRGDPEQYGEISIYEGWYQVTLHGFPEETRWTTGERRGKVESDIYDILRLRDMRPMFGKVPLEGFRDFRLDPELTLELSRPDQSFVQIALRPSKLGMSFDQMWKTVENGPLTFGKDDADRHPGRSVLWAKTLDLEVFGVARTAADVDAVAFVRTLPQVRGTKTCSGYERSDGSPAPDITLALKETEIVVRERRTGQEIGRRTFPPVDRCPMFALRSGDDRTRDSSVPNDAIEDYLRSLVTTAAANGAGGGAGAGVRSPDSSSR